jgi:hypothetical protein
LFDEEIEMMPVGELCVLYYSLMNWDIDGNVIPHPVVSRGLKDPSSAEQYEYALQQRIYRLRPELHNVQDAETGHYFPVLLDMSTIRTVPPARPDKFGLIWYGVLSAIATGGIMIAVKTLTNLGIASLQAQMQAEAANNLQRMIAAYNRGVYGNFWLYQPQPGADCSPSFLLNNPGSSQCNVLAKDWTPVNFLSLALALEKRKLQWVKEAADLQIPNVYTNFYYSPTVGNWMDSYERLLAGGVLPIDTTNVVSPSQMRGGTIDKGQPTGRPTTAPTTGAPPGTPQLGPDWPPIYGQYQVQTQAANQALKATGGLIGWGILAWFLFL